MTVADKPIRHFQFVITARKKGAIGLKSRFVATRSGTDQDKAQLALYDEFEHIVVASVREVSKS